jgi:3,4-dihydroxy 2-butanone 4-phosphate synthase/GTP cyclohydrolase II
MAISPVPELVAELAAGRMVILVDEEDRENEGDLVLAAEQVTPEAINFMARHARGLICLTLTRERCERLRLPPMAASNGTKHGTAFTVSIEAATGVSTGISAADRARTIQAAVARDAQHSDLVQPGHVFPLQAQDGGVLMRAGHTEAGCDLAAMAGLLPASVICEVMKDDGTMARLPDLELFARDHGLKIGTIADLIGYRSRNETLIEPLGSRPLVTPYGRFECVSFRDKGGGIHLALKHGQWDAGDEVPVRVHEPFMALDLLDVSGSGHSWPLGTALAGLGGVLHVSFLRVAAPASFTMLESINTVLIVIIGGAGFLVGPVLGAVVFVALPEGLRLANEWRLVIFGALLVLITLFAPSGLAGLLGRLWTRLGAGSKEPGP